MNTMMDGWSMMSMMVVMFCSGLLLIALFVLIVVLLVKWFLGSTLLFPANEGDNAVEFSKRATPKVGSTATHPKP